MRLHELRGAVLITMTSINRNADQLGEVDRKNGLSTRPMQASSGGRGPRPRRDRIHREIVSRLGGPSPVDVFRARAEARAFLFAAGELDLHEAVDALQANAVASGLLVSIGQDAVQAILSIAFREARRHV
jgi:hypothetical protein